MTKYECFICGSPPCTIEMFGDEMENTALCVLDGKIGPGRFVKVV